MRTPDALHSASPSAREDAPTPGAAVAQLAARWLLLTVGVLVSHAVAGALVGTGAALAPLRDVLPAYALEAAVLAQFAYASRWTGARLAAAVFVVHAGVTTALTQVETLVFLRQLASTVPAGLVPRLVLQGAVASALIAAATALLFGQRPATEGRGAVPLAAPRGAWGWTWRVALSALLYLVVYVAFGALVFKPLAGAAFDRYYGHLEMPAWMPLLQLGRGLAWTALGALVIAASRGSAARTGLNVALLFAGLMGALLLLPNPYLPAAIRGPHFVEVASSNFVYGWIVAALLFPRRARASGPRPAR